MGTFSCKSNALLCSKHQQATKHVSSCLDSVVYLSMLAKLKYPSNIVDIMLTTQQVDTQSSPEVW